MVVPAVPLPPALQSTIPIVLLSYCKWSKTSENRNSFVSKLVYTPLVVTLTVMTLWWSCYSDQQMLVLYIIHMKYFPSGKCPTTTTASNTWLSWYLMVDDPFGMLQVLINTLTINHEKVSWIEQNHQNVIPRNFSLIYRTSGTANKPVHIVFVICM